MLTFILTVLGISMLLLVVSIFYLIRIFKTIKEVIPNKHEYSKLINESKTFKNNTNKLKKDVNKLKNDAKKFKNHINKFKNKKAVR